MPYSRVSNRYAKGLLDYSLENGVVEKVLSFNQTFIELWKQRDFRTFIKSPIVSSEQKINALKEIYKDSDAKEYLVFVELLINNGRSAHLKDVADSFMLLYRSYKGNKSAKFTSPKQLSKDLLNSIFAKHGLSTNSLDIETVIDSSLIGGYILQVGDIRVDQSVSSKLKSLKNDLGRNLYQPKI